MIARALVSYLNVFRSLFYSVVAIFSGEDESIKARAQTQAKLHESGRHFASGRCAELWARMEECFIVHEEAR